MSHQLLVARSSSFSLQRPLQRWQIPLLWHSRSLTPWSHFLSFSTTASGSKRAAAAKPIKVAVIGAGRIGVIHAENAHESARFQVRYVVTRHKEKAAEVAKRFGAQGTDDLQEVLDDEQVQAVIVASPTSDHASHVQRSLKAGKAVFCEKPLGATIAEIDECFRVAEQMKLPLLCGYQRCFDPSFAHARKMITEGLVGQVQLIRLISRDHPPPPVQYLQAASSGSFFDDFATHDVDQARFLANEGKPTMVYACASQFLGVPGVDDTAAIVLKLQSGALVVIENSRRCVFGYDIRAEVLGTKGMIRVENPSPSTVVHSSKQGINRSVLHHSFPERFADAYRAELHHFADMMQSRVVTSKLVTQNDCATAAWVTAECQKSREKQLTPPKPSEKSTGYVFSAINVVAEQEEGKRQKSLSASSASSPSSSPSSPPNKFKFALIGCGRMGRVRAHTLSRHPECELLWVVDLQKDAAARLAAEVNGFRAKTTGAELTGASKPTKRRKGAKEQSASLMCQHGDLDTLSTALQDPRVNAVVISTTTAEHASQIMLALEAGKHVFVEKPLAMDSEVAAKCLQAAQQRNLALYCGFQRRFDPHYSQVIVQAQTGRLGAVEMARISSRDGASHNDLSYLAKSGSIFFDSMIHDFDAARWLFGEMPCEVFCAGSATYENLKKINQLDTVVAVLRFPSGGIATIDCNRRAMYGYDQRLEVFGSQGMLQAENPIPVSTILSNEKGHLWQCEHDNGIERYLDAYRNELHHFVDVIAGRVVSRVKPQEIFDVLRIAEAALRSHQTGQRVAVA